jgi:hypothetical protein
MPTLDRTTIKSAVDELLNKLRSNLAADPPTASKPFRKVEAGSGEIEHYPRPFLSLRPVRARAASVVDDDKVVEVTIEMRIVADIAGVDPYTAVCDQMGAVEDYLDSIRDSGIIDGSAGFDERTWALEPSKLSSGGRVSTATAQQTLLVKMQRGFNRIGAA